MHDAKSPAKILIFEHKDILVALGLAEEAVAKMENNKDVSPEFWKNLLEFLKGFADKCHHAKEENYFLPAAKELGGDFPRFTGDIFAEHRQAREYVRGLGAAVEKYYSGDKSAEEEIFKYTRLYVELLKRHVAKENKRFPEAESRMTPETIAKMAEDFEKVEREEIGAGVHEKYRAVLEREKELLGGS